MGSALLYSPPTARSVLAPHLGLQRYRHTDPSWTAVPDHLEAHAFQEPVLRAAVSPARVSLPRTARHFPLFPTGPPAHS